MSNANEDSGTEILTKVVISPQDVEAAMEFFKHFEIPLTAEMTQAVENFCKDPTLDNQEAFKRELCTILVNTQHEALDQEMFVAIRKECEKTAYEMNFRRDLERTLAEMSESESKSE